MSNFFQQTIDLLKGMNAVSMVFRILLATMIGGFIGSERERRGRSAGLRTHILICLGAAITGMIGLYLNCELGLSSDPMRLSAQVISGIGFIGAGTIILDHQGRHVIGLTTAAGIWTTATLGIAIGVGFYLAALVAFGVVMATISFLSRFERDSKYHEIDTFYLEINDANKVNEFYDMVANIATSVQILPAQSGNTQNVGMSLTVIDGNDEHLLAQFREYGYVVIAIPVEK